jgi:PKD repeat protein
MGRTLLTHRVTAGIAASLLLAACTTHKQETPSLTGPSGLGTSLVITVSPDVLTQDGTSQSLVQIQAYDSNGSPLRNKSLRVEIAVDGVATDFGSLSARNVVTDNSGRASAVYTAPAAPAFSNVADTVVQIQVTPAESDFGNATARFVNIRLTPPGTVTSPSPLRPGFVSPAPTVGNPAVFQATVVDATGADATTQVAVFQWNFGDGGTAAGQNVTHTYNTPGTFPVTLTITDTLNRTNFVTHGVTVGQGALPVAAFITSPASPIVDQSINFNASGSTVEPGHTITDYAWNFGDGTLGSGALTTHSYSQTGTYTVTLKVTDDAGRKSNLVSQTITVGNGTPSADFTFNPSAPKSGQQVVFDGSPTQASPGRTIVSYSWSFGDGGSGTGVNVTHTFTLPAGSTTSQTFNVLLTVTDNAGKTSSITKPITINP